MQVKINANMLNIENILMSDRMSCILSDVQSPEKQPLESSLMITGVGRACNVMLWCGHRHCVHFMHNQGRKQNLKVRIQIFPNVSSCAQIWGFIPMYLYYETVLQDVIISHLLPIEVSTRKGADMQCHLISRANN